MNRYIAQHLPAISGRLMLPEVTKDWNNLSFILLGLVW